jgi:lactate dehydrogenase-like 2-hydroxyacid dehydrogenase
MKRMIIATTIALGLACVSSVGAAQDQTQTTNMQNVTVTGVPAQYETYTADLHMGYGLQALVGSTHKQYVQAQRAAERSEALRMRGMAQQPFVAVAIDNSSGPGVARQIQLIDSAHNTVAIVNVYCKRAVPSRDKHCFLAPLPVKSNTYSQRLASMQAARLQVAVVALRG